MTSESETSAKKWLTMADVQKLVENKEKCVMVINNRVYDVTKFLDEHPGGEEVLKEQSGKNASDAFEDVGHSSDAREQMKQYEIAELHPNDAKAPVKARPLLGNSDDTGYQNDNGSSWIKWIIPLVIAVAAVALFKLLAKSDPDISRPPKAI